RMQAIARNSHAFTKFSSLMECYGNERELESRRLRYLHSIHRLAKVQKLRQSGKLLQFINSAEQAYSFRNVSGLRSAALNLFTLEIAGAREISGYYLALSLMRTGQTEEAKRLLETVADSAPAPFRSRAVQSLGAISLISGDLNESASLQVDALKIASETGTCD